MKILINHPYLEEVGGAEQVFSQIIRALIGEHQDIVVLSGETSKSNLIAFEDRGIALVSYSNAVFRLRRFQVYQKFLRHEFRKKSLKRKIGTVDLEILTQDVMFLIGAGKKRIAYVHYPENLWRLESTNILKRMFWRVLYFPVLVYSRKQIAHVDLFVCNSQYTRKAILNKWKRNAEVVYPPVDVRNFSPSLKEDFVVTVGRFVRTKNYELVVEVAKQMPTVKFMIIGRKQNSDTYYEKIERVKPPNVELLTNVSPDVMSSVLSRAKVYLHTMVGEHFGISVVEAMAAGCIPVVHNIGGTKESIANFGYAYGDVEECVGYIRKALDSNKDPRLIAEHAERFSSENFRKTFVATLQSKGFI